MRLTDRQFLQIRQTTSRLGTLVTVGGDVFKGVELCEVALAGSRRVDKVRSVARGVAVFPEGVHESLLASSGWRGVEDVHGLESRLCQSSTVVTWGCDNNIPGRASSSILPHRSSRCGTRALDPRGRRRL